MPEENEPTSDIPRANVYLRFDDLGVDKQRAAIARHICQRRANELGAVITAEYVDIDAGRSDQRKQLQRMLSDLAVTRDINFVIVPDHSTVAHYTYAYGRIIWQIEQAGARLVVASIPLLHYPPAQNNPGDAESSDA